MHMVTSVKDSVNIYLHKGLHDKIMWVEAIILSKRGILDFAGGICYTGNSRKRDCIQVVQSESPGVAAPGLSLG